MGHSSTRATANAEFRVNGAKVELSLDHGTITITVNGSVRSTEDNMDQIKALVALIPDTQYGAKSKFEGRLYPPKVEMQTPVADPTAGGAFRSGRRG